MVEREYTDAEKKLLKQIMEDKYSVGSFSGMIANARFAHPEKKIHELTQEALQVRLHLMKVVE